MYSEQKDKTMGKQKTYEAELRKYDAVINLQEASEAPEWWQILEMLRAELREIIFGDKETPNWWRIFWNIGKIIAKVVSLLFIEERAQAEYSKLKQAYDKKNKPSSKDG